jgi:hypothetical protein
MDLKGIDVKEIAVAASFVYVGLLYFLPPKVAKKIEPLGRFLQFLAGTPTGAKRK